uniref:Cathepsin O n=1 Tax=Callorhinchus milii TaxID=7868 RepID=A0A4W3I6J7_CALMI
MRHETKVPPTLCSSTPLLPRAKAVSPGFPGQQFPSEDWSFDPRLFVGHCRLPGLPTNDCAVVTVYENALRSFEMIRHSSSFRQSIHFTVYSVKRSKTSRRRDKVQHALNSLPSDLLVEKGSATYGINQFSDLAPELFRGEEFEHFIVNKLLKLKRLHLPTRFDWRDKNVVTRVRNQGSCGGCWAFSVVEVIESAYAIKGKPLQTFSAQEVIDCSYKDGGCNGGSPVSALKWLNQTRLVTESMYPFKAKTGMCHHFPMSTFGISIKGYQAYSFRHKEEEMMHKLLEWGPLIAVVDAVSWQDYLGGIIQHHCSPEESNHAVVITGYDRTGDIPYWIVRNSWGSTWGIDGFVHIKMKRNVCGIADSVAAGFV